MRGFKDGNYNVTFDGIPWGDTNNPTHHSNSFFPASTIGATIVDRGPGSVGDLGQANFGGNIKLFSNRITDDSNTTIRQTIGSWNGYQSVLVWQTGKLENLHGLAGFFNIQANRSDGFQSYSPEVSSNWTTKFNLPINDDWSATLFITNNHNKTHVSDNPGGTPFQVAKYGKSFNLTNDPTLSSYTGYNIFRKDTTFGYLMAQGNLPWDVKLDSKVYISYYNNNTNTSLNAGSIANVATGVETNVPGGVGTKTSTDGGVTLTTNATDLTGYNKLNHYQTWGNITNLTREFSIGTLRAGTWMEIANTNRHTYEYDITKGFVPDYREKTVCLTYNPIVTAGVAPTCATTSSDKSLAAISYEEQSKWWMVQAFTDFVWKATDALTITPGVKWQSMKRTVDAAVIKSPRQPQHTSNKNTITLKNLQVNYKLMKNWSVYGNYAEGAYLPDIAALYVINPNTNTAQPSLSTNYQAGTVFQSRHWAIDADVYDIKLTNLLSPSTDNNTYINIGKARASGIEGQISYAFDFGLTAFVNGSKNKYINDDTTSANYKLQVSGAPKTTTSYGVLYHNGKLSSSLIYKQVGLQYGDNAQLVPIKAFNTVDLAINYDFGRFRIKAQVNNLTNSQAIVGYKGVANLSTLVTNMQSTYTTQYQAGTNSQLTLIAKF